MGIKQNLKLWENHVTYIDEDGFEVTKIVPRTLPTAPWKIVGLLNFRAWVFFIVGL